MASIFALSMLALSSVTTALPQQLHSQQAQIVGGTEAAGGEVRDFFSSVFCIGEMELRA